MALAVILHLANLFFSGLLAGTEVVVHYALVPASSVLDDPSQLRLRQALIRKLRILVPALFIPALFTSLSIVVNDGSSAGVIFRCAGLTSLLLWFAARVIATVPINSATLNWTPDALPEDWKALIARAERFHIVGVWGAVLAFACFLAAAGMFPQNVR